jgi:hypothetical protein
MNNSSKLFTLSIVIIIFILSLTLDAVRVEIYENYEFSTKALSALDLFLIGPIAFIGGGFFETLIWIANPLLFFSLFFFLKDKKAGIITLTIGLILVINFRFWKTILKNEGGGLYNIKSFETGYYLWLSCFILLLLLLLLLLLSKNQKK